MFDDVIYDFHNRLNAGVINIPDPLKKADTGIELCNLTLSRLKELIEKEDFENVPDEIDFFKKRGYARFTEYLGGWAARGWVESNTPLNK